MITKNVKKYFLSIDSGHNQELEIKIFLQSDNKMQSYFNGDLLQDNPTASLKSDY